MRRLKRMVVGCGALMLCSLASLVCISLFPDSTPSSPERPSITPTQRAEEPTEAPSAAATPVIAPTSTPRPPISPMPTGYVVQPGDTLAGIAGHYDTTAEAICAFNELEDCSLIRPGQELLIPSEVVPTSTRIPETPTPTLVPIPPTPKARCEPSYPNVCIPIGSADYDCAGGSGNGPNYIQGPIQVRWDVPNPDPHGLDRDRDGWGCE